MASLSSALGSDLRCGAKGCIGSEDTERVEVFRWESSTLGRKMLLLELSPFSKYDRELIEHILDKRNTENVVFSVMITAHLTQDWRNHAGEYCVLRMLIVPVVGMIPMSVLMIVMVTPIRSPHTKEYAKDNLIPSVSHCIVNHKFYVVALVTLNWNRFTVFKGSPLTEAWCMVWYIYDIKNKWNIEHGIWRQIQVEFELVWPVTPHWHPTMASPWSSRTTPCPSSCCPPCKLFGLDWDRGPLAFLSFVKAIEFKNLECEFYNIGSDKSRWPGCGPGIFRVMTTSEPAAWGARGESWPESKQSNI